MANEKEQKKEFDQIKYQQEYNKAHYDRIEFTVPKGERAVIREAAKKAGLSLSEYISQAVRARMESEK